ncbi:MAG: Hsp20/alpha crystallin family protein [Patescibacteria group bacterium]
MSLIKWAPFLADNPFEDMDKVMRDLAPEGVNQMGFSPAVDIYEDKNNVIIETQLAGIDPAKVDISIDHDILTIKGEGEKKSEVEDKNYYRKEIRRGSFFRSIQLPTHVAGEKASAMATDGVLKISVPKVVLAKPKTIKIQTSQK